MIGHGLGFLTCANFLVSSFSPVVLFLKVLLSQLSLDTPFTGGLGSYKLYVLVADHLRRYLALGGADRPGEVLLTFLYRYGCCDINRQDPSHQTKLHQHKTLEALDGASADLSNVFKLADCLHLFRLCWDRLWERVQDSKLARREASGANGRTSFLAVAICPNRLRRDREAASQRLKQSLGNQSVNVNTQDASAVLGRRTMTTTPADSSTRPLEKAPANNDRDRTLQEIVAGYGVTVEGLSSH